MRTKNPSLTAQVDLQALHNVVAHLFRDEYRDFQAAGEPEKHIFRDVAKLAHSANLAIVATGRDPDSSITTTKAEYRKLMRAFRANAKPQTFEESCDREAAKEW